MSVYQTCTACQYVDKANRKMQAAYVSQYFGFEDNADLVGAINILAGEHAALACEETGLPDSMKQKPGVRSPAHRLVA